MSAGGLVSNVTSKPNDAANAGLLAAKLLVALAGFTSADMELDEDTVEDYICEIIVHVGEPGTPGYEV